MSDPEVGRANSSPPIRPLSADGTKGGPSAGLLSRWIRKIHANRTTANQAYAYYGAKPQTVAEQKLVAQYNSQAAVLGSSTAIQVRV